MDSFPICLDTQEPEEVIETVKRIAPTLGGINLEDIAAPNCFEIEEYLRAELDIPVNNVLAFPGIFRGALDAEISQFTDSMFIALAEALTAYVINLMPEHHTIPDPLDRKVADVVAEAMRLQKVDIGGRKCAFLNNIIFFILQ